MKKHCILGKYCYFWYLNTVTNFFCRHFYYNVFPSIILVDNKLIYKLPEPIHIMVTNTKGVIGLVHSKTASDDDVTV